MRSMSDGGGFTSIELLVVVLLLGILIVIALSDYLDLENIVKGANSKVDQNNVNAINSTLALYKLQHNGGCPADATAFDAFLGDASYFPDGRPTDPFRNPPDSVPYQNTYSSTLCWVQMVHGGIDHTTGAGH